MILSDEGSPSDLMCKKTDFLKFTSQWTRSGAHENGSAKVRPDGSFKYYDDSGSGRDWTTGPALKTYDALITTMHEELSPNGEVWHRLFQPSFDLIEHFLKGVEVEIDGRAVGGLKQPLLLPAPSSAKGEIFELDMMPLATWLQNGQEPKALQTTYKDTSEMNASDRQLVAVVCTFRGQVIPGSVSASYVLPELILICYHSMISAAGLV